jgi:hypothetical protein
MSCILKNLKFGILRVPPIQIPIKRLTHSSKIWLCVARKTRNTRESKLVSGNRFAICGKFTRALLVHQIFGLDLSDKFFSVSHASLPPLPLPLCIKFGLHLQPSPWELESWNFGSHSLLGQLDALHTKNFGIQAPKDSHLREVFWGFAV